MYNRLIIFLIRRKLGVKKYQDFRFKNQKARGYYYFDSFHLIKVIPDSICDVESGVSLNWLLSDECEIEFTIC